MLVKSSTLCTRLFDFEWLMQVANNIKEFQRIAKLASDLEGLVNSYKWVCNEHVMFATLP